MVFLPLYEINVHKINTLSRFIHSASVLLVTQSLRAMLDCDSPRKSASEISDANASSL